MGIPPEKFQQAPPDPGYDTLTSRGPEDSPAVRQALDAEVDTLSRAMGHTPPAEPQVPAQPQPTGTQPQQPPAGPFADTGQSGADLSKRSMDERTLGIMEKYKGNFEKLAEAHAHTDAARTRAQQRTAEYGRDVAALNGRFDRLESLLTNGRPATPPQYGTRNAPVAPATPPAQEQPLTGDDILSNPEAFLTRMEQRMDGVVRNNMLAYTEAQVEHQRQEKADRVLQERSAEIQELQPIMDEIYYSKPGFYDRMPKDVAVTDLLERARDRHAAIQASQFYQELRGAPGGNGIPASDAAPSTTGALPPAGGGPARRPAAGAITDYSNSPAMNRLWRSRSDSREETKAVTDVLKEREFWNDVPNQ